MIHCIVEVNTIYLNCHHKCVQSREVVARELHVVLLLESEIIVEFVRITVSTLRNKDVERLLRGNIQLVLVPSEKTILILEVYPLGSVCHKLLGVTRCKNFNLL